MICTQIFEMINMGIVVLDKELMVTKWNRWMETTANKSGTDYWTFHI